MFLSQTRALMQITIFIQNYWSIVHKPLGSTALTKFPQSSHTRLTFSSNQRSSEFEKCPSQLVALSMKTVLHKTFNNCHLWMQIKRSSQHFFCKVAIFYLIPDQALQIFFVHIFIFPRELCRNSVCCKRSPDEWKGIEKKRNLPQTTTRTWRHCCKDV